MYSVGKYCPLCSLTMLSIIITCILQEKVKSISWKKIYGAWVMNLIFIFLYIQFLNIMITALLSGINTVNSRELKFLL